MERAALGAMSGSCAGASPEPFRRFEVYTGAGRRRVFTTEEKLTLVARMVGCDNISELARRHDLRPSQLFTWRRELRYAAEATREVMPAGEPLFVPAVVAPEPVALPAPAPSAVAAASTSTRKRSRRARASAAAVELVIDGVAVKIARGADPATIAAVIDALKKA